MAAGVVYLLKIYVKNRFYGYSKQTSGKGVCKTKFHRLLWRISSFCPAAVLHKFIKLLEQLRGQRHLIRCDIPELQLLQGFYSKGFDGEFIRRAPA